ncbi:MAG TPA: LuxR C-terminal-related transcriptional regulator [Pseudonocardiaceae bacterium]|nr:LuxR C-terminal-related transcriptional regulator [Pseudonocardiaceae bacterium]
MAEHNEVANQATTRIVLQHHDRLVRDALAHWLVALPGCVLAGSTGSRPGLVRLCTLSRPDIVLLDVSTAAQDTMATVAGLTAVGTSGIRAGTASRSAIGAGRSGPPCLIGLHGSLDVGAVARLHRAGVRRLVSYRSGLAGLRAALSDAGPALQRSSSTTAGLTGREQEVLALICAGRSAAQIAVTLEISPHTVVNHTRHIFAKLDVRSRTQAAAEVARLGLLGDVAILPSGSEGWQGPATAQHDDVKRIVASAVARGADAVLTGEGLVEQLPAVLAMVRAGYLVAPAGPVRALLAAAYPRHAPLELTRRELDILGSIRQGHSVRQTAQALGIAVKTVQSVQRQLFLRLGARNRTEALALADGLGLVDS